MLASKEPKPICWHIIIMYKFVVIMQYIEVRINLIKNNRIITEYTKQVVNMIHKISAYGSSLLSESGLS